MKVTKKALGFYIFITIKMIYQRNLTNNIKIIDNKAKKEHEILFDFWDKISANRYALGFFEERANKRPDYGKITIKKEGLQSEAMSLS